MVQIITEKNESLETNLVGHKNNRNKCANSVGQDTFVGSAMTENTCSAQYGTTEGAI